ARRNTAERVDLSLVELSHLAIRPDSFGLAVVQERDRVGRGTLAGRWVWKKELRVAIEEVAIGAEGVLGATTEDGRLVIFDPAGAASDGYKAEPAEPLCLIEAVPGAPYPVAWHTLARRSQVLRGHDAKGRVIWESPVPWEGWQLQRLGPLILVSAPDGRALAYDGAGHLRSQCKATDTTKNEYGVGPTGEPCRVSRQGVHLICAGLDGRVRWRSVASEPIGPLAVGQGGVAVLIGRALCWFPSLE
ncbi:MAG: hypothetical protein P4L84_12840, partial [Isosphaeraceae bacterium]|nr:hypothetical protein [Isosphaeraceae bacterium]